MFQKIQKLCSLGLYVTSGPQNFELAFLCLIVPCFWVSIWSLASRDLSCSGAVSFVEGQLPRGVGVWRFQEIFETAKWQELWSFELHLLRAKEGQTSRRCGLPLAPGLSHLSPPGSRIPKFPPARWGSHQPRGSIALCQVFSTFLTTFFGPFFWGPNLPCCLVLGKNGGFV